jgi:hypothetical protein
MDYWLAGCTSTHDSHLLMLHVAPSGFYLTLELWDTVKFSRSEIFAGETLSSNLRSQIFAVDHGVIHR